MIDIVYQWYCSECDTSLNYKDEPCPYCSRIALDHELNIEITSLKNEVLHLREILKQISSLASI